jgi:hypothetical protein
MAPSKRSVLKGSKHARKGKRRMSQQDQQLPEEDRVTAVALMRAAYGKRYVPELYDLAGGIQGLRDSGEDPQTSGMRKLSAWAAKELLATVISSTDKLRQVADALDALDSEERWDRRMANITCAYANCGSYPPTFPEVRQKFIEMFGEQCWPQPEFSVRKTLKVLGLPLAKARPGRPGGSRSQIIGNPRRVEK